jgi:transcriptional regulator with XRE-family HTH domain
MASKYEQIWDSFGDEEYRREFADDVGTGLAFQIRMLREKNGWTQTELASRIGSRQETISLWENPNYGKYTLKTLKSLARAFDLVPVFRLGAFGELVEWNVNLSPDRIAPPSFDEEYATGSIAQSIPYVPTVVTNAVMVAGTAFVASMAFQLSPTFVSASPANILELTAPLVEGLSPPSTTAQTKEEGPRALAA